MKAPRDQHFLIDKKAIENFIGKGSRVEAADHDMQGADGPADDDSDKNS